MTLYVSDRTSKVALSNTDSNGNSVDTTKGGGPIVGSYPSILLNEYPTGVLTPSAAESPQGPNIGDATVNVKAQSAPNSMVPIVFNNPGGAKIDAQGNIIQQQELKAKG